MTFAEYWERVKATLEPYDADTIETMRHVFVGGAVAYRELLYDSIPEKGTPDDADGWAGQAALDRELDAIVDTLQPLEGEEIKH